MNSGPTMAADETGSPYFSSRFQAFAHRGGRWPEVGENSPTAFRRAAETGYRYLETDVHATADGELVAFHDTSLDRVTDGSGPIAEHTIASLADLRVEGGDPIPRLADLLTEFPDCRFNLDIKAPEATAPLAELIAGLGAEDRVCVSSFSLSRIRAFRRLASRRVATGLSAPGVLLLWLGPPLLPRLLRGQAAQVPLRFWGDRLPLVTRRFVRTAHRYGIRVHVWTVNDAPTMERLIDLGVDGIVTDEPDLLKAVLVRRDMWEE